jgi:hypothetical protein
MIQAALAKIHHETLLEELFAAQRAATLQADLPAHTQRTHPWRQKLFLLRLRRQSRRHHLAQRHYATPWRDDLRQIAERHWR